VSQFTRKKTKEIQIACGTLYGSGNGTIRLYAKIDGGANTILKTITLTPQ
jgi:hypothetical protein